MDKKSFYDFTAKDITGNEISMESYKGKVVLVVNTASKCGFTPQYTGLEKLYKEWKDKGFVVLGFPCDQFAHQEPGDDKAIANFCSLNFGVSFPLFKKINVNGKQTHPLFSYLKKALPGFLSERVKWNFTKFLIDAEGKPLKRYASKITPEAMHEDIEKLIKGLNSKKD